MYYTKYVKHNVTYRDHTVVLVLPDVLSLQSKPPEEFKNGYSGEGSLHYSDVVNEDDEAGFDKDYWQKLIKQLSLCDQSGNAVVNRDPEEDQIVDTVNNDIANERKSFEVKESLEEAREYSRINTGEPEDKKRSFHSMKDGYALKLRSLYGNETFTSILSTN